MRTGNLRRTISFLLSFIMVLSICFAAIPSEVKAAGAGTITIDASKSELHRGDLVDITVSLSGNESATGVNAVISYDSDMLQLQGNASLGDAKNGAFVSTVNDTTPGNISAIIAMEGETAVNGVLFTAQFVVKDTAKGNLNIAVSNTDFTDINYGSVTPGIVNNTENMRVVVPVTGITLNKQTASIARGASEQLTAALAPADADSTVTWTSSNPSVASVSADGTVTANAAGSAVITATADGKSASCTVTVTVPLNGIAITGGASTIKKGTTTKLSVTYDPEDTTDSKTVTWTSSDSSVATVDSTGLVTAVADGTATITAKVGEKTATRVITVKEVKLTGIEIKEKATIYRGETEKLAVTYIPEDTTDDRTIAWTSSDTDVATVDNEGNVTALKEGTADITATAFNGKKATSVITVKENHLTQDLGDTIEFDKLDGPVLQNQAVRMYDMLNLAKIIEENHITDSITIKWSSSNKEVATVDQSGWLKGLKEGTTRIEAVITATDGEGNETGKYTVGTDIEIKEIPLNSIAFDKIIKEMKVGDTEVLSIIYNPADTTVDKTVEWSTSDAGIISVKDGKITALKAGKATITAKVGEKTVSCEIEVKQASAAGGNAAGNVGTSAGTTGGAQTGDAANIMLYLVLILMSLITMFVLQFKKLHRVR